MNLKSIKKRIFMCINELQIQTLTQIDKKSKIKSFTIERKVIYLINQLSQILYKILRILLKKRDKFDDHYYSYDFLSLFKINIIELNLTNSFIKCSNNL